MTDRTSLMSYLSNGLTALFGLLTVQEIGMLVGVCLGILTFWMNLYFKYRQDKRDQLRLEHDITINSSEQDIA